jgi:hypothetical protein
MPVAKKNQEKVNTVDAYAEVVRFVQKMSKLFD